MTIVSITNLTKRQSITETTLKGQKPPGTFNFRNVGKYA